MERLPTPIADADDESPVGSPRNGSPAGRDAQDCLDARDVGGSQRPHSSLRWVPSKEGEFGPSSPPPESPRFELKILPVSNLRPEQVNDHVQPIMRRTPHPFMCHLCMA